MAIPYLNAKVIGRSGGRSSTAAAAYRAACRIVDVRSGEVHDYTHKRGVRETFILTPPSAPDWMKDREKLWNGVELTEDALNRKRNVAQLARELVIALPHELAASVRRQLLIQFVKAEFVDYGMVADVAIHEPGQGGDIRNEHAHVMLTLRLIEDDQFGEKERAWNSPKLEKVWKAKWTEIVNRALEAHGFEARIEFSHEAKALAEGHGVALADLPTVHLGPTISAMERRGVRTALGDTNREVAVINSQRALARKRAKEDAKKLADHSVAPRMRLPEGVLPANKTRKPQDQQAAPLMRLTTLPNMWSADPNPSMESARRIVERTYTPVNVLKAKARVGGTTTSKHWTDADRQAWRHRLVEQHYQEKIDRELVGMLDYVDLKSIQDGLRLKLVGGGQLQDFGDQIQASGQDLRAECRATVALCKAKGWATIVSSGPPEYLAIMREEAANAGLQFNVPGLSAIEPEPPDDEPRPGPR